MYKIILLALAFFIACDRDFSPLSSDKPQPMRTLTQQEQRVADVSREFGVDLFKSVSAREESKNIFISPLSVSMALGMTMNGADSSTYAAIRNTLGFEGLSEQEINQAYKSLIALLRQADPKVIFEIANSIWYRNSFSVNPLFLETNKSFFDATILPKDFDNPSTVREINRWVSEKTHGKITDIIDQIDPMTLMFLINAIYFKGTWKYEFDKEKTASSSFYLMDGSTSACEMMHIEGNFNYYANQELEIVDLPYGDGNFSMTIILPAIHSNVNNFIENTDLFQWRNYLADLDTSAVILKLPKFKLDYKLVMNQVLDDLGMGIAFSPDQADFSRIVDFVQLYISQVLHKSFVQVDEEGTEAAAVTVVEIRYTSVEPVGKVMQVDRPFIFVLREKQSGTILFMGKILKPVWQE